MSGPWASKVSERSTRGPRLGPVERLESEAMTDLLELARAIDAKSPLTAGHSERVAALAVRIGRALDLPDGHLDRLHRAGLLHDVGKITTPSAILDKTGKLTRDEYRVMQDHVHAGASMLEPIPAVADIVPLVLHHHEWYNGAGYPNGLAGEAITLGGRVLAVADVFDAVSSNRPYRPALDAARAIDLIREGAGRQFDPRVVGVFIDVVAEPAVPSA